MSAIIEKLAVSEPAFRRRAIRFPSARAALRAFFASTPLRRRFVLLPAYIGVTSREGSGVFDPVREAGLGFGFYRMSCRLEIDLDHLADSLRSGQFGALVLIHYFGYVDPGYETAISLARQAGVMIVEDEAHALFTDLIGNCSGRLGDAAVFSLHKLLPVAAGGMLIYPPGAPQNGAPGACEEVSSPWDFDLAGIARRRVQNTATLTDALGALDGRITPLREIVPDGVVPQTYPILINSESRDAIHRGLNQQGYGAVTLYYRLIDEIDPNCFPESYAISRHILNLPVHQDVDSHTIRRMAGALAACLEELE